MIRRPPRSTRKESSAASDVYKRQNTNLAPGFFNGANWTQQTQPLDYLGYVPNNTEILPIFDSADPSTVLDQGGLFNFNRIDVSDDGEVLIGLARYDGGEKAQDISSKKVEKIKEIVGF